MRDGDKGNADYCQHRLVPAMAQGKRCGHAAKTSHRKEDGAQLAMPQETPTDRERGDEERSDEPEFVDLMSQEEMPAKTKPRNQHEGQRAVNRAQPRQTDTDSIKRSAQARSGEDRRGVIHAPHL